MGREVKLFRWLVLFACIAPFFPACAQGYLGGSAPSQAVVYIETQKGSSVYCASGFVIHSSGLVATCYHVVEQMDLIRVRLPTGRWYSARVVGSDGINDLAVLKIAATGVPALKVNWRSPVSYGQAVTAYGYPLCSSLGSELVMTPGQVTAKRGTGEGAIYQLKLDAMPGNSGGPLLNAAGEVIGILFIAVDPVKVLLLTGWLPRDPISFAVPAVRLEEVVPGVERYDVFAPAQPAPSTRPTSVPAPAQPEPEQGRSLLWDALAIVGLVFVAIAIYSLLTEGGT